MHEVEAKVYQIVGETHGCRYPTKAELEETYLWPNQTQQIEDEGIAKYVLVNVSKNLTQHLLKLNRYYSAGKFEIKYDRASRIKHITTKCF